MYSFTVTASLCRCMTNDGWLCLHSGGGVADSPCTFTATASLSCCITNDGLAVCTQVEALRTVPALLLPQPHCPVA